MALRFDMSKGDWQRDYLMQQQMNEGVNPYRELGENLATATGALGGALGKVVKKKHREWQASGGSKKLREKFPNWFTEGDKFAGDAEGYKKAYADWLETEDAKAGTEYGKPNPKDYGLGKDGGLYKRAKFTPLKGLLNLGKGAATAAAVVPGAAILGGKKIYDASKKYITESPDYFEGDQDSPLMRAIKGRFEKRKQKKRMNELRANIPISEDDDFGGFSTIPTQDDYTSVLDELAKRNMKPTIGNFKKVADNKLPPVYEDFGDWEAPPARPSKAPIPAEIEAKQKRDAIAARNKRITTQPALYNPRVQAAKDALLLQNYGPLQSILQQEKVQKYTDPIMQEKYADPILDTTNMLQGVDTSNVKALPRVNPFQRGMR